MKKNNLFEILLNFEKGKPASITGLIPCFLYDILKNLFSILQGVMQFLLNLLQLFYNNALFIVKSSPTIAAAILVVVTLTLIVFVIIILCKACYKRYYLKSC